MKICLVGPGNMSIPPTGWGAVEIIIWEFKKELQRLGHQVFIINTRNKIEIINTCNSLNPDIIHIHYDVFWDICDYLICKKIILTSHYGYIDQEEKYDDSYRRIMSGICGLTNTYIFALSQENKSKFMRFGFDVNKIFVLPNGINDELFNFSDNCIRPNDSIYLGKIEPRKRQSIYQDIDNLYFAGDCVDRNFNMNSKRYLGSWNKESVYKNLTNFANLVLLSDGEAHPLVCIEAMSTGLGLVVSEFACANLDTSLPFIDVVSSEKMNDVPFIQTLIEKNRKKCINLRNDIKKYAHDNFSIKLIVEKYLSYINKI